MAIRTPKEITTRPAKNTEQEEPSPEMFSQRKRPAVGRYSLQVDRQVKQTFTDLAAAEEAGAALKKKFPILQVVVYDNAESKGTMIEAK